MAVIHLIILIILVEVVVVKIGGLVLPDLSSFAGLLHGLEDFALVDETGHGHFLHVEVYVHIVHSCAQFKYSP